MAKNRKLINIEEVENGWIMTYTITGSGQQKKTIHSTRYMLVNKLASWLDEEIEVEKEMESTHSGCQA